MGERRERKRGGGGKGCGSATLIAEFGTRKTSRSSQVIGSSFQSFSQLPQADGAFKIQCLLSVPFLSQLRTQQQQQQLQLLTYTHGTYPNIYMYRCNTTRRLAVDPHTSTVTFLINCGRLCLCFVLVLFPNVKLWFILVWQSFFFSIWVLEPYFSYFWILCFLLFSKKIIFIERIEIATSQHHNSTLCTPHSTLYTPHFALYTLHSTLYTPHFALYTLHFTLHTLHSIL